MTLTLLPTQQQQRSENGTSAEQCRAHSEHARCRGGSGGDGLWGIATGSGLECSRSANRWKMVEPLRSLQISLASALSVVPGRGVPGDLKPGTLELEGTTWYATWYFNETERAKDGKILTHTTTVATLPLPR